MKKSFSLMTALFITALMLVMGCKNASNITFEDTSNKNLNENGLAEVTIKLGKDFSRAIYPDEWSEGSKEALFYVLKGEATPTPTVGDIKDGEVEFTYAQLKDGTAKVELAPIAWTSLTLTAYQGTKASSSDPLSKDTSKVALQAKVTGKAVDLSKGSKDVTFNLSSVGVTGAKGGADITVNFYNEAGKAAAFAVLDIVEIGSSGTSKLSKTAAAAKKIDLSSVNTGNEYKTIKITDTYNPEKAADTGIEAGNYLFKVTFYDSDPTSGKIMCQYTTHIKIEGGNTSTATINLPKGIFNSKPVPPMNLTGKCYFAPVGEQKLVVNEGKQEYAQDSTKNPVAENKYNVVFTWEDKSYNEAGFILHIVSGNNEADIKLNGSGAAAELIGTKGSVTDWAVASLESGTNGTMGPDCNSITLSLPVGTFIDKASVVATNSFGNSTAAELTPASTKLGMFTVAYDLSFDSVNGSIKLGSAVPSKNRYFIQAFNYNATDNFIEKTSVTHTNGTFAGWTINEGGTDIPVTKLGDLKTLNPGSGQVDKSNQNVTLKAIWTSPTTIKIAYPSHTEYKSLKADSTYNDADKITPTGDTVTFTIPAAKDTAEITDVTFDLIGTDYNSIKAYTGTDTSVTDGNGVTTTGLASTATAKKGGETFEWNIKTFLSKTPKPATGIYSLKISYNYAKSTGATKEPVDGTFYIEVK